MFSRQQESLMELNLVNRRRASYATTIHLPWSKTKHVHAFCSNDAVHVTESHETVRLAYHYRYLPAPSSGSVNAQMNNANTAS